MNCSSAFALVSLVCVATAAPASAQIIAQERDASAETLYVDGAFGYTVVMGDDSDCTALLGDFDASVNASIADASFAVTAEAPQSSEIDALGNSFFASGSAVAGLYVQGTGSATATNAVSVDFILVEPGSVFLDGEIVAVDAWQGQTTHDTPGSATASVRVEELGGDTTWFEVEVSLGDEDISLGEELLLPAGSYRVSISAVAFDQTGGIGEVHGSIAAASFYVEGSVVGTGPLSANVDFVSLASGGTQELTIHTGPELAGSTYAVVGSLTGSAPGTLIGDFVVPIVVDAYTTLTIQNANGPLFVNTLGILGGPPLPAAIQVPPGLPPALAGFDLVHAFVALDLGEVVFASNPVRLTLE